MAYHGDRPNSGSNGSVSATSEEDSLTLRSELDHTSQSGTSVWSRDSENITKPMKIAPCSRKRDIYSNDSLPGMDIVKPYSVPIPRIYVESYMSSHESSDCDHSVAPRTTIHPASCEHEQLRNSQSMQESLGGCRVRYSLSRLRPPSATSEGERSAASGQTPEHEAERTRSPSRNSIFPSTVPTWAKEYYGRGSVCLTQVLRRGSIGLAMWGNSLRSRDGSSEAIDRLIPGHGPVEDATQNSAAFDRATQSSIRPSQGMARIRAMRETAPLYNTERISGLSWEPDPKSSPVVYSPRTLHVDASLRSHLTASSAADVKVVRKLVVIFSLGFLFPPLWIWGCLLNPPTESDDQAGKIAVTGELQGDREVHQWKLACAVMLGMAVVVMFVCVGVALTMRDMN